MPFSGVLRNFIEVPNQSPEEMELGPELEIPGVRRGKPALRTELFKNQHDQNAPRRW
jgi:hypothetical protein